MLIFAWGFHFIFYRNCQIFLCAAWYRKIAKRTKNTNERAKIHRMRKSCNDANLLKRHENLFIAVVHI